jgi:hypothetical protein
MVTMMALLIHGRSGRLPKPRYVFVALLVWGAIAVAVAVAGLIDWSLAYFMIVLGSGLALGMLAPQYLISLAESWAGRRIGVLAILINIVAFATVAPVLMGVAKGFADRAEPQLMAKVSLGNSEVGDWRLVIALGERVLLTRVENKTAFRVYKIVSVDRIESFESTRSAAPWAP